MQQIATFHDLKDQSVFITGGGSGIGASLTEAFMAQGAKVAFVQRSDGSDFCTKMKAKFGISPLFIKCDITDVTALQNALQTAVKAHGHISVLVNNAANDLRHTTAEVTEEFWDKNQALNLKAYFFAAQAVVDGMKLLGKGSIINFSSISYMMGNSGYPSYVSANAGINGLTRGLAREFGPDNIRTNAIAPGWVLTDKQKRLWVSPEALANHLDRQCIPAPLEAEDIVNSVLFLASDTSKAMTGQMMVVDGGVV